MSAPTDVRRPRTTSAPPTEPDDRTVIEVPADGDPRRRSGRRSSSGSGAVDAAARRPERRTGRPVERPDRSTERPGGRAEATPARRTRADTRAHSPVMVLIVLLATLGVVTYAVFLLNPANRGDFLPYGLVIVAESVLVGQSLLSMWTILSGGSDPRDFAFHNTQDTLFDLDQIDRDGLAERSHLWPMRVRGKQVVVDVFITVYGEELTKIAATVAAAVAMRGEHRTWVLDDGRSDDVRALADRLGARYVRRLSSNGAKAGNINHALTLAKGDYFAVFDADFVPGKDFLFETVPFFADGSIAFVQTPQTYGNLHNLVSRGAGYMQTVFYRFIQPGRNRFNAAFCVGTNVIFRRAAIDDVGGIHTDSKSEDVWTSLHLHERGWKSVFIPMTLAVGDAPETIEAFSKQQLRWATGGFEILLTHFPFNPKRKLTMDQRLQYFVTASFYLTGIVPGLLLLVPPLEIFFDLRPMNMSIGVGEWVLFYLGFYLMQVVLAFYALGSFRYETLLLAAVSFPIYARALWNVLCGKEQAWHVTGAGRGRAPSPFNFIVPQVLVFVFLSLTSVVAIWRDVSNGQLTLATAWNITNSLIFGAFIITAFREQSAGRRAAREERDADTAPVFVLATVGLEPAPALRTQVVRPDALQSARDVITASAAAGTPTPVEVAS
ncbi:cellulose synthase catalytic subunit [Curtobacterium sp. MCSS17_015]|uniref:glycosyltransferase family 2 protein n=1 Tax=Curtobacterium sp. MCSS17_015 TaxID=2175666 RepID=UPI000DA954D6|nr:cellulose synthase catalytic subunit [Curtobacterium sp. MCSS17_015]WIB26343.1 cellulose synthase catalytic subunit [Curtobacterium sp. MCSS17_015]